MDLMALLGVIGFGCIGAVLPAFSRNELGGIASIVMSVGFMLVAASFLIK